jgi:sec-independent protein translocase protein TatA
VYRLQFYWLSSTPVDIRAGSRHVLWIYPRQSIFRIGDFLVFRAHLSYDFKRRCRRQRLCPAELTQTWTKELTMIGELRLPGLVGVLSPPELLVIVIIALLIFGPKKLGDLGKGLGESIRSFKSGLSGNDEATKNSEAKATEAKDSEIKK